MNRFEISCRIFFHAMAVYMLLTLPTLAIYIIYFISLCIALLYGILATILFWLCFTLLWYSNTKTLTAYNILFIAMAVTVLIALQVFGWTGYLIFAEFFSPGEDVWDSGIFLLLPLFAIMAGWKGIHHYRRQIFRQFLNRRYVQLN